MKIEVIVTGDNGERALYLGVSNVTAEEITRRDAADPDMELVLNVLSKTYWDARDKGGL